MRLNLRRLVFGASITLLAAATASATAVSGTANIASPTNNNATVFTGAIYFGVNQGAGAYNAATFVSGTGDFANVTSAKLENLVGPSGPSGGPLPLNTAVNNFADFTTPAGIIQIDLTGLKPGYGSPAACGSTALGAECTPVLPGNIVSPFTLVNTPLGVSINLDLTGIAYLPTKATGYSDLIQLFTTETVVSATIPQVLAGVESPSGYTSPWSAQLQATPVVTPEPASLLLLGIGLLGAGLFARKRTKRA